MAYYDRQYLSVNTQYIAIKGNKVKYSNSYVSSPKFIYIDQKQDVLDDEEWKTNVKKL